MCKARIGRGCIDSEPLSEGFVEVGDDRRVGVKVTQRIQSAYTSTAARVIEYGAVGGCDVLIDID